MYTQSLGRFGSVDVAPIWRVNSGGVYSLTVDRDPGRATRAQPGLSAADISPATRETVFFGERGANDFKGYGVMDLAATYNLTVWRTLRPWFKVEVYNLLNNQKLIAWDRTVTANAASHARRQRHPDRIHPGPRFGQGTAGNHFPQPWPGQNGGRASGWRSASASNGPQSFRRATETESQRRPKYSVSLCAWPVAPTTSTIDTCDIS